MHKETFHYWTPASWIEEWLPYHQTYNTHFYTLQHLCQGGGVRVINGYINQNIFTSMLWTCGAWWKIRWWVPIVYWPVTMTKLWWLPFWYPGCPRWCLKIDFSRTVNWYHLHSYSEHYKHCTIQASYSLNQCGLRYWGQDSHSPTPPACYKQGIVFYIWERDLGRGCVLSMGCVLYAG